MKIKYETKVCIILLKPVILKLSWEVGSVLRSCALVCKIVYYINTNEIPSELLRENMVSSHVKRSLLL